MELGIPEILDRGCNASPSLNIATFEEEPAQVVEANQRPELKEVFSLSQVALSVKRYL